MGLAVRSVAVCEQKVVGEGHGFYAKTAETINK